MASGFICRLPIVPVVRYAPSCIHRSPPLRSSFPLFHRCHGMMCVPHAETDTFLEWLRTIYGRDFAIANDFPMSSKIYLEYTGDESGSLTSFTTICPGAAKYKDAYWTIDNVCQRTLEASYIFKYVHRQLDDALQPVMHAVFDASAKHKVRAEDALHVGSLCRRAGALMLQAHP